MKYLGLVLALCLSWGCTKKQIDDDKILYLHSREGIRSLDPVLAQDVYSQRMVLQVYEGLLHFHYLKRPLVLEPQLAEDMPEISKDGKVITFKLKKGIRFQDDMAFPGGKGREVEAEDFIYSWKRLADPANKSESYWIFRDKVVGYDEWREKLVLGQANYSTPIAGLQALDKHTLKITLKAPNYQILFQFASAAAVVVAREVVQHYGTEFSSHPVGTGAYVLKSWTRNSKLILERSPTFRAVEYPREGEPADRSEGLLASAGERLPLVSNIVIYELTEEQPQWLLFQKRELDVWQVTKDYLPEILDNGELRPQYKTKHIQLALPVSQDVTYVGMNMENPYLKDKKIRQAIAYSYDQSLLLKKFFNSLVTPAHGPIPPLLDGYRSDLKNPYQGPNIEKAKALLVEAGYPNGEGLPVFKFEMAATHTTARQMAEYFKEQVSQIGIRIQLQPNTWPQFNEKLKSKKADIFEMAWNGDYPDAENFLQLFYSKNISPGPNSANYSNPQFDQMFEHSLKLAPGPERTILYQKMEGMIIEDVPWIFNLHRRFVYVRQPWVKNHKHNQMVMDTYKYLDMDRAIKEKFSQDTL